MPELADILGALLDSEDPELRDLQNAVLRALQADLSIDRALGIRGSARAAYYKSRRNLAMQEGAWLCDGVGKFTELYSIWRAGGEPDVSLDVVGLFEALDECEAQGVGLPNSDSQLRLIAK